MSAFRKLGNGPHRIAVLHGGPGAPGAVSLLAESLSGSYGILEPFQTADSISGQISELADLLQAEGSPPITLIGSSWGAWLSFLFAARHPSIVRKIVLIGCPTFDDALGREVTATRLRRLTDIEREEAKVLLARLGSTAGENKDEALRRIGMLFAKADSADPLTTDLGTHDVSFAVHAAIWKEATRLRARGEFGALGHHIRCPVLAIHGDRDPHPADEVESALRRSVSDLRFVLLRDCGHFPWIERKAREQFLNLLKAEL